MGIRIINTRGIKLANKGMITAAIDYNLKNYSTQTISKFWNKFFLVTVLRCLLKLIFPINFLYCVCH